MKVYSLLFLLMFLGRSGTLCAEDPYYRDLFPDTWVATDALGRTMPINGRGRSGEEGPAARGGHLLHCLAP